jgi:hypothetical protein
MPIQSEGKQLLLVLRRFVRRRVVCELVVGGDERTQVGLERGGPYDSGGDDGARGEHVCEQPDLIALSALPKRGKGKEHTII